MEKYEQRKLERWNQRQKLYIWRLKKNKEAKFHRRNLNGKTEKNELTREIKGVWKS